MDCEQLRKAVRKVKLLALDLDGTALTPGEPRVMTERTAAAIRALLDRGVLVVPTTGRSIALSVGMYARELAGCRYVISVNGALATDLSTGEDLYRVTIPAATAAALTGELMALPGSFLYCHGTGGTHTVRREGETFPPQAVQVFGTEPVTTEQFQRSLLDTGEELFQLGVHYTDPAGDRLFPTLAGHYPGVDHFQVGYRNLEYVGTGAGKGKALRELCKRLSLPAQAVCAMGDNGNDVDMIAFAGLGVAMGNAIPEAKAAADYVTADNAHEGVAQFLEEFFLG